MKQLNDLSQAISTYIKGSEIDFTRFLNLYLSDFLYFVAFVSLIFLLIMLAAVKVSVEGTDLGTS